MLRNLSIGVRLGIGFGTIFIIFSLLILFAINRMQFLADNTSQIYKHPLTVSNAVLRVNAHIIEIHRSMKDVALDNSLAAIERDVRIVNQLEKDAYVDFAVAGKWFLGDKTLFAVARETFVTWKPIRDKVIALMRAGKRSEAAQITKGEGAQHVIKIENAMEALSLFAKDKADEFLLSAEETTKQAIKTMYLLLFFLTLVGLVFAVYLARSITRPLKALQAATREIGRGHFTTTLEVTSGGELGALANSVREMAENLNQITASRDELNREIVERKKTEEARQILMEDLENKAAEMERFVYTVSHDLKSPLITIQGFLGLLEKDVLDGDTKRLQGDVAQIKKAAKQMQELLEDLLELSRIGRLVNSPGPVLLSELVTDAMVVLAMQIKESGAQIDIMPDLPTLFGDRKRLLEVIQNLLDNALKFSQEQTTPHIEIGSRLQQGERVCYIKDNGLGIEPRYHERVFELFERLNPQVEGTGIGLTIIKRIIGLQGGRIWVESAGQGQGCSFCFVLPEQNEPGSST